MKDEEIRIWLTGKETNIRLLLSTLHHVSQSFNWLICLRPSKPVTDSNQTGNFSFRFYGQIATGTRFLWKIFEMDHKLRKLTKKLGFVYIQINFNREEELHLFRSRSRAEYSPFFR